MRRREPLWLGSTLLALVIVIAAVASGSDVGYLLTVPGLLLAWPVWPEGIHTRPGPASALGFYLVYLVGNLVFWSLVLRMGLGLIFKGRGNGDAAPEQSENGG